MATDKYIYLLETTNLQNSHNLKFTKEVWKFFNESVQTIFKKRILKVF